MGRVLYQPWRKGPAQIIPFPVRFQRAWVIRRIGEGAYRGEVFGEPVDGPTLTGVGSPELVMAALKRPENRRGLPIVPCWRADA